jgi:glycosyltransferase involved in cell wall biosynthesis
MPRRGGSDAELILNMLKSRGALDGWRVDRLEGLRHAEVADRLSSSRIYLALSPQEGFGLPAAEAMACGNYVIGYHGYGGRELFRSGWSYCVEAGDVIGVARALEYAIAHDNAHPKWCMHRGIEASRFVLAEYSPRREMEDVVAAYSQLVSCH